MTQSLQNLIRTGTKLWLDSVDPDLVVQNRSMGVTGATSNPIIIADLIRTGRFDADLQRFAKDVGLSAQRAEDVAWKMTDHFVSLAEGVFIDVYKATKGDDGYVSFELDPLLEDKDCTLSIQDKAARYHQLAVKYAKDHPNRMIKVPATPGGLAALENIAAEGIPLNVTLIFSERQYRAARDAVWRGAKRRGDLSHFKSVYSIFVSRIDVYADQHYQHLSAGAQGEVGTLNAKVLWQQNHDFWQEHHTPLKQEIIFASTGTKKPTDKQWKYVAALAGSDIQTNPPATNAAVAKQENLKFTRTVDVLPPPIVCEEIMSHVNWEKMEQDLMREGLEKFSDPHKALIKLIAAKIS